VRKGGIMKKIIPLLFILFLTSCATMQKRQEPTLLMSHEAKLQYYQEQITRYNYLLEQEKLKTDSKK
jgi:hypothetical protein